MSKESTFVNRAIGRRTFLKGVLATAGLAACNDGNGALAPIQYDPATAVTKNAGYYGLAETPFFKLKNGRLINVVPNFPPAIDFHTHLGFTVGPKIADLLDTSQPMKYLMDCDAPENECELDYDVYLNEIASDKMLKDVDTALIHGPAFGKGPIRNHTVWNLVRELDEMQFDKSVLLPIKMNLVQPDAMEERWLNAVNESKTNDRFEVFSSVHLQQPTWKAELEAAAARGAKGIKFHPTMQRTAPNSDEAMELFQECSRLKLAVFFHAGRAGIEPAAMQPYAMMENYVRPLEEFSDVQFIFGHSGARDWQEAFGVAKAYENVWMELAGPSITWLKEMTEGFDKDRLLFGSDWPFYPIAASLVRVLHVTWGDDGLRDAILSGNARRLLNIS